jgi:signal recognition particle subunit SRP54
MLETLTAGFTRARERLAGVTTLSDENLEEALGEVRRSLLEADVDFAVAKDFVERVRAKSVGMRVETKVRDEAGRVHRVTPGQHFVKVCEEELAALMGPVDPELAARDGVVSVLLLGLQGVGKTTIAAKLARQLLRGGKKPLLVAADVQRPAAVEQLERLGASIDVAVHRGEAGETPPALCRRARERARSEGFDAIVYDTAGRLAIDDELMAELAAVAEVTEPANTLLVCDALMGRDAVNVARAFSEQRKLDGVILTKLDGDARGGAALAVKAVTGVPIKFVGTGESVDRLEEFRPEGLASRILGMGDVVGLVRDFEEVVDTKQAEEDAERLLAGRFGMEDLLSQLRTIQKMGPLRDVLGKLPGMGQMAEQVDERELIKTQAMIQSMTPDERTRPERIDKSRASRIARGSGRSPREVQDLVARFRQMREMMGALGGGGGGLLGKIPGMGRLAGAGAGGPAGFDPAALLGGGGNRQQRRQLEARQKTASKKSKKKRKQAKQARRKGRRR